MHSSLTIIFPLHLLYLLATTEHTATSLLKGLRLAITNHLVPDTGFTAVKFPYYKFFRLAIVLTVGITLPGLLWFAAVSLASSVVFSILHAGYLNKIRILFSE